MIQLYHNLKGVYAQHTDEFMNFIEETIRPSADLRNHYGEISELCNNEREAVIITVNGKGNTVLLSYDEYKRIKARIELLEMLAESEEDVRKGRVYPFDDGFKKLKKEILGK